MYELRLKHLSSPSKGMLDAPSRASGASHLKGFEKAWHGANVWKGEGAETSEPFCAVMLRQESCLLSNKERTELEWELDVDSSKNCSFLRKHNWFTTLNEKTKVTAGTEE